MKIGITGGVASGKSTVIRILGDLGAVTISADGIYKNLTSPGADLTVQIINLLGEQFAESTLPPTLNRARLASAVFNDPALRTKLELITHPPIISEIRRWTLEQDVRDKTAIVVAEVPLLFEAGLESMFDLIVTVWCSRETQTSRLKDRLPELDTRELLNRIESQIPLDEKRTKADIAINSEKPLADMIADVADLYNRLQTAPA